MTFVAKTNSSMKNKTVKILQKTPAAMGYTFPAEWEPHVGTWFSWPRPEGISFPGKYHTVPENLARIFKEIARHEQVHINVPNDNWEYLVREQLKQHGCPLDNIFFHYIKTNESWCRDHGPAFVIKKSKIANRARGEQGRTESKIAIVDWAFNAWGGKYPPYDDDDNVPTRIAEELKLPVWYPKVVMEGGSVEFNGAGTVLTTTDCLLNKNRNPKLGKKRIEKYLKDFYGQKHVCWLTGGIEGDDTDGHIDDLARFISPTQIVFGVEKNPKDANYRVLKRVRKQLDDLRDQDGNKFEIIELPMPKAVVYDKQRLPATYMNFYFVNGAVLVPTYRDKKNDNLAQSILQKHLPKHEVIGIDCVELIWGLGAIHCLSQQWPAV